MLKELRKCSMCGEPVQLLIGTCPECNNIVRPLDNEPTSAIPGSPKKLEILTYRASMGYNLWHPKDGKMSFISKQEFITSLVATTGLSESEWVKSGYSVVKCECDSNTCTGWKLEKRVLRFDDLDDVEEENY